MLSDKKTFAQFQRSDKKQSVEWLFSDEYGGGFNLKTGNSGRQKEYSGTAIYPLLNIVSDKDQDFIYLEINSRGICP